MTVALLPVGPVDMCVIDAACESLRDVFDCDVQLRSPIGIGPDAYDAVRRQYSSSTLMQAIARVFTSRADRTLGVTEADLFIPMLTFVFGQAQLSGRNAIVSFARLRQSFYGLQPDPELLSVRMRKEITHEIGHTLGLIHCPDRQCVMSVATSIQQVDTKGGRFCSTCHRVAGEQMSHLKEQTNEAELADSNHRR